jgi:predicted dehydrogenase
MSSTKELRLGIVGLGNMGRTHATNILAGRIPRCRLAAVCDENQERLKDYENIPAFTDVAKMMSSGEIDAILVATPHYSHTTIGIAALKAGLHVLVEKPISVHKADCERLIAAHKSKKQVFSAMFNQRTDSFYQKIRELVKDGTLGEIRRVTWTITDWFRTEAYYASGGWRATWAGEGGGVLLNQCPHNLDLYQWIFGLPDKVRGFCSFGKHHDIEVEDDVTAYFEYKNGMTGVFITSTGEAPGANRLEISGENGRLVYEKGKLLFTRNEIPMTKYSQTTAEHFGRPGVWNVEIPVEQKGEQHNGILKNFTNAVLDGEKLLAPAAEGINSVELGNAILFSSMEGKTIDMPMSAPKYEARLKKLIAGSRFKKKAVKAGAAVDFSASFGR